MERSLLVTDVVRSLVRLSVMAWLLTASPPPLEELLLGEDPLPPSTSSALAAGDFGKSSLICMMSHRSLVEGKTQFLRAFRQGIKL